MAGIASLARACACVSFGGNANIHARIIAIRASRISGQIHAGRVRLTISAKSRARLEIGMPDIVPDGVPKAISDNYSANGKKEEPRSV